MELGSHTSSQMHRMHNTRHADRDVTKYTYIVSLLCPKILVHTIFSDPWRSNMPAMHSRKPGDNTYPDYSHIKMLTVWTDRLQKGHICTIGSDSKVYKFGKTNVVDVIIPSPLLNEGQICRYLSTNRTSYGRSRDILALIVGRSY